MSNYTDSNASQRNAANDSHTINIGENQRADSSNNQQTGLTHMNFLTFLHEARNRLERQSSQPTNHLSNDMNYLHHQRNSTENGQEQQIYSPSTTNEHPQGNIVSSWRINLNDVFSFSSSSSTEALRSLIPTPRAFRYAPIRRSNTNDLRHFMHHATDLNSSTSRNTLRSNSLPNNTTNNNVTQHRVAVDPSPNENNGSGSVENAEQNGTGGNDVPAAVAGAGTNQNRITTHEEEDTNMLPEIVMKTLSHFIRYLPFICILFVKFIHDHLLGILDLLLLYSVMYHVNKSFKEQVSKFSQKSYLILARDFGIVCFMVIYRFVLSNSEPDIFGLLINPPNIEMISDEKTIEESDKIDFIGYILATKRNASTISLGLLLYYVSVNDLVLKLITILVKISFAAVPSKFIRHKLKGRIFVLIEYISQLYRALVPIRQWVLFLFGSYVSLEIISGILFSSFYLGAKGFETAQKLKCLKKALMNVLRDIDYERKPTKNELDAAGLLCPICHDGYNSPVVLQCGHIFCDDCVGTWFKREQTCPMCRAKVSDDPTWQDGSTTFFFQLC